VHDTHQIADGMPDHVLWRSQGHGPVAARIHVSDRASWHPSLVAQLEVPTTAPSSTILLGGRQDHVAISFRRTPRPDADDDGWVAPLAATAAVSTGSFAGTCDVSVREEHLLGFRRQVARVSESHEEEAVLTSIEERLCVRLRVQPQGRVVVQGHASDDLRDGSTLVFAVRGLDHRFLLTLLRELRKVELELGIRAATDTRVEVRSRFDGSWVPGFEVAEVREVGAERLFRVRRCSDGLVLPTNFGSEEVRMPALMQDTDADAAVISLGAAEMHRD
jgi:hypothetical protein